VFKYIGIRYKQLSARVLTLSFR